MRTRRAGVRFAVLVAIVAALLALTATTAFAGTGPTLGVQELQSKIDQAGGSMHGHLETVLKGSTITSIAVDVLAVTYGYDSGPADMSSLILFQATGPEIDKIGGIAAGMSGSPIYVNDAGTDKLIGALSYGDIFTLGGVGLATPIEAMVGVQQGHDGPGLRSLSSPVYVDGAIKDRVLIVDDPSAMKSAPAGTIVASPKSNIFIGGINPKSRVYQAYAKHLESRGVSVVPLAGGLSSKVSTYNAAFEPGSSIAVLAARGDLWYGGVGTVTYTDDDQVVAFGHPAFWEGETSLFMCNAWVDGVWPSTLEAYKLARPAALRGTLVEDRLAAVMGIDGEMPKETVITARATNLATGKVATSSVGLPRFVANSSSWDYWGVPAMSAYIAGSRVFDSWNIPGSAVTTTTVTVNDGTRTYVLVRRNVFSDKWDIAYEAAWDVDDMVTAFQAANGNGIAHADILSVDLKTEFSANRREASIVDISVAGGLRTGENTVTVSLLQHGNPTTQTVNVPLTIPAGTPLTGRITACSADNGFSGGDDEEDDEDYSVELFSRSRYAGYSNIDRRTVTEVVDDLNAFADNTVLGVSFKPIVMESGEDEEIEYEEEEDEDSLPPTPTPEFDAIESTAATNWVVSGVAMKVAPQIEIYCAGPKYGNPTMIRGSVTGVYNKGKVTIAGLESTPTTAPIYDGMFYLLTPPLCTNTTIAVTFAGDDSALPASASRAIKVCARTTLSASKRTMKRGSYVTLTARVLPQATGGRIAIQRWNGWMWVTIKNAAVPANGTLRHSYKATKRGTVKFRARFLGSPMNEPSVSSQAKVRVY